MATDSGNVPASRSLPASMAPATSNPYAKTDNLSFATVSSKPANFHETLAKLRSNRENRVRKRRATETLKSHDRYKGKHRYYSETLNHTPPTPTGVEKRDLIDDPVSGSIRDPLAASGRSDPHQSSPSPAPIVVSWAPDSLPMMTTDQPTAPAISTTELVPIASPYPTSVINQGQHLPLPPPIFSQMSESRLTFADSMDTTMSQPSFESWMTIDDEAQK